MPQHPPQQAQLVNTSNHDSSFSMTDIMIISYILVGMIFMARYIKNILLLNRIKKAAYCHHHINHVGIYYSDSAEIPFCWSGLNNHFVIIPNSFLQKREDLRLAVRHELQHIRQGDTRWLQMLSMMQLFCFFNPFIKLWMKWMDELQEFSCDESIVLRRKASPHVYAQCLINSARDALQHESLPQAALGIHGLSKSILYRRVAMLFNYTKRSQYRKSVMAAYAVSLLAVVSTAYALNGTPLQEPLTATQVTALIENANLNNTFHVKATPEVVTEINDIRSSDEARAKLRTALDRMKEYQPYIEESLKKASMPADLLVLPLVESGYQPLTEDVNPVKAAGIWQFIPGTAKHYGLVVNKTRDDRLNTELSTKAALSYLNATHEQFQDWRLAVIAYEIGEKQTAALIKKVKSRDPWVLARSPAAPESLKKFSARLDAELIIMHNPGLIAERA
jgi:hypothetical protein